MKFVSYTSWKQLPENASSLFEQAEKESIFFSRQWFESVTATALERDETLQLACVVIEDKVLAILPLIKNIGKTGYSLKHRYTSLYSLVLAKDHQDDILACLVQGLIQLPLNALLLEPVADNDSNINSLLERLKAVGFHCSYDFRFYNWILRVQGQSYVDYMAARPATLRNTLSRKRRKLEREHKHTFRLFTGDEVPHAMSDYHTVYNASWKANEQYEYFVDNMVAGFSKRGWTRLAILYINGLPAAAQLWFVCHGKASIFRLSYDKAWKQYSPGSILTCFLMEYVIDIDKVDEIDFLTGNDTYKQDWMSERRERFVLSCVKNVGHTGKYKQFVEWLKCILKTK